MLKRTIGFLLTIALIHCVAYAQKAYAVSATVVISNVQPGISGGATKEYITLYNNSTEPIEVTNWCVKNKTNVAFVCITPPDPAMRAWIAPQNSILFASQSYADTVVSPLDTNALLYVSTNQSSGAFVGSADTVTLIDDEGLVIDSVSWTSALTSGAHYARKYDLDNYGLFIDTDTFNDWKVEPVTTSTPESHLEWFLSTDECIESCVVDEPVVVPKIRITEILPNVAGSDTGKEFIELYNDDIVPLDLFGIILQYGANGEKQEKVTKHILVDPHSYYVLTPEDVSYILPNTTGLVRLLTADAVPIFEMPSYDNPKEDQSWAYLDDVWQFTNMPTPGKDNLQTFSEMIAPMTGISTVKPCAANQYRNTETNRCRAISAVVAQVACNANQYRNAETGRCKATPVETVPTGCKEGQERNLETNRCRAIKTLAMADFGLAPASTSKTMDTRYVLVGVGAVVIVIVGYAVWEWRVELRKFLVRMRWRVLRR